MKVLLFEEGASSGIYRVGLEDGSLFFFRDAYLKDCPDLIVGLAPGALVDEVETLSLREAAECLLVERHAHRLVARQEHSRALLSVKLEKRDYPRARIAAVLDELEILGLLDDKRYARMYGESLLRRSPLGSRVLAAKLRAKGLGDGVIRSTLDELWTGEQARESLGRWLAKHGVDARKPDMEDVSRLLKDGFTQAELREYTEELD